MTEQEEFATTDQNGKLENFCDASLVEEDCSDGDLLMIFYGDSKPDENWILDMACTFHNCSNTDWFSLYEIITRGSLVMENNDPCKVAGIGNFRIKLFDRTTKILGLVRHVSGLNRNNITLDLKGYIYIGGGGVLKVSKVLGLC